MFNTIILKKGEEILTSKEFENFSKGDTVDSCPEELKRWSIEEKEAANNELKNYKCSYEYDKSQDRYYITEYALEYCKCDEYGEFLSGSDYEFAEE